MNPFLIKLSVTIASFGALVTFPAMMIGVGVYPHPAAVDYAVHIGTGILIAGGFLGLFTAVIALWRS